MSSAGYERTDKGYAKAAATAGVLALFSAPFGGPILAAYVFALAMCGFIALELHWAWRGLFVIVSGFALCSLWRGLVEEAAFPPRFLDYDAMRFWSESRRVEYNWLSWTTLSVLVFVPLVASSALLMSKASCSVSNKRA